MILQNKNAIVYGAGGSPGGAVARVFAHAGAGVFLSSDWAGNRAQLPYLYTNTLQ